MKIFKLVIIFGITLIELSSIASANKEEPDEGGEELSEEGGLDWEGEKKQNHHNHDNRQNVFESTMQGIGSKLGEFTGHVRKEFGLPDKKVQVKNAEKEKEKDLVNPKKSFDWSNLSKLIFNPFELIRAICAHFGIPLDKFLDKLGRTLISGVEPLLYPLVFSTKIVEKVFVPDHCRLKFVCSMGKNLEFAKETVLKFSPNFLEGSIHLKALSEGIVGRDCATTFKECEPKLSKQFEELASPRSLSLVASTENPVESVVGSGSTTVKSTVSKQ